MKSKTRRAAGKASLDPLVGTDLAYRRWLVNDSPQWVRCMIGRDDSTVDMALLLAFRAGRASSSNAGIERPMKPQEGR